MSDLAKIDPDAVVGCLLGQAIGDMIGLPMENLSPRRITKLFPNLDRPRFIFGYGMGSDDTEHACMTAQALLRSGGDEIRFRRSLAWQLRWWSLAFPAGIGRATLRACVRLWLGWPSDRSGVNSAGNGAVMRAAILFVTAGVEQAKNAEAGFDCVLYKMGYFPWISEITNITHINQQAIAGVWLVYGACRFAVLTRDQAFDVERCRGLLELAPCLDGKIRDNLDRIKSAYHRNLSVREFASDLGLTHGVTGYVAHSVPVAIYAFLRHPDDYRTAIESVIRCGGDTDTVAAITGALVGARVGKAGIPKEWLDCWADWPRSVKHLETLGQRLADGNWRQTPQPGVRLAWWAIPFRNLLFLVIVLAHVVRRLLPPY